MRSRKLATQVLEAAYRYRLLVGRDELAAGCVGRKETCPIRFLRSKVAIQVVEASYAGTNIIRLNDPATSAIDRAPVYPSPIEPQKVRPSCSFAARRRCAPDYSGVHNYWTDTLKGVDGLLVEV